MKNVNKSRSSYVYKYLTTDSIFGLVDGLRDRDISTTCDVRRALIMRTIKLLFVTAVVILVSCLIGYFMVMAPVIILLAYCLYGVADTMSATFALPVIVYGCLTAAALIVYGCLTAAALIGFTCHYFDESESKPVTAVKETYEFLKNHLCSKIDWVD